VPAGDTENQSSGRPDAATAPTFPEWKETFLARYSRNTKMAVLTLAVFICASPWLFSGIHRASHRSLRAALVQGVEWKAAVPNPAPARPEAAAVSAKASSGSPVINDQDDRTVKMALAPDVGLTEDTAQGSLPRIGLDGRQPWQVYARPFNAADTRPRIALIVAGLGLSRADTEAAITRLPANVTLAFDVESRVVGAWCARARQEGHETLLEVPMEPFDYPHSDPGPDTLLTTLPNSDNIERLLWALRQATGYVGITSLSGSHFTTDPEKMQAIADVLKHRGLMMVDARVAPHSVAADVMATRDVPVASGTEQLDQNLAPAAIDDALNQLEQTARLTGRAIGITSDEPVMTQHLEAWLKRLPADGVALAPVSAMVK
jgi:polysaccharide deacetylase 2 family uncharacterized protein YibQ